MARSNGFVEIAHSTHAEDFLPPMVLFEYLEHLILTYHVGQFGRIVERRNTQQQAVIIFFEAEEIKPSRVGEQRSIVEVHVIVDFIIGGIKLSCAFQELGLGLIAPVTKHFDSLFILASIISCIRLRMRSASSASTA